MNTASHVAAARTAEAALDWATAAAHYFQAIALYPTKGNLANLHIAKLTSSMNAARGMVEAV